MTRRFLFEEQEPEPKSKRKKKVADSNLSGEQIRRMVDVNIGEFSAKIPESALETVISFIRELLMADMNTDDVIELIITQVSESGRSESEVDLIRKILRAIDDKFDPEFINKIPATFPFLAAMGADEFSLSELDRESMALLNFGSGHIGRGEVAIPLLFGIDKFAADNDADEGKGTKTYDLVYNGKEADIKDYRNKVKGKLVDQGLIRIGGPSSELVRNEANELFKESSIDFVKYVKIEDFTGMDVAAESVIKLFKNALTDLSDKKLALMTRADIKKELDDAIIEIVDILDTAVQNVITKKYPGGFFTIDEEKIAIVPGSGFEFYACKPDKRIVIAPVASRTFKKGLQKKIDQKIEDVVNILSQKTGKPVEDGTIDDVISTQNPAEQTVSGQPAEPQDITEAILRRLIRSL